MKKSIRLVASDIDGTLIPEGTRDLNPQILKMVRKLKDKGIVFAAASGRQFDGMKILFHEVEDDMIFISNNGAYVSCRGTKMFEALINPEDACRLISYIRKRNGCFFLASTGAEVSYIEEDAPKSLRELLIKGYGNNIKVVPDILELDLPMVKISMYREEGVRELADSMKREWEECFRVLEAGDCWLDFVDYRADKGIALESIQKALHFTKEETMCFGDNLNDIGMLEHAAYSYAIGGARSEVKDVARYVADTVENDGVLKILEKLV